MSAIGYQAKQLKENEMQSVYKDRIEQLEKREMRLVD